MASYSHSRARDLFFEALDLPPETDRSHWLSERTGGDLALAAEVKRLLDSNARETQFMPESGAIRDSLLRNSVRDVVSAVSGLPPAQNQSGPTSPIWTPPTFQEINDLLPAYEIIELIGRGGMGAVYRGSQLSLERPVAIKILPSEFEGVDPSFTARFRREALSMANLDHPNIVTIHDFGSVEPSSGGRLFYIAMEFVSGTDLHRLIASGKLNETAALDVVSQICEALQYAHDHGYVHRDIKPANIFVSETGVVKVGDFGLAKLRSTDDKSESPTQLTMAGYHLGTPHYMAPEAIGSSTEFDHRADIYSVGVMFYEMLTDTVPRGTFKSPSAKNKGVDERLDDIVIKAMREAPEERYQQVSEVKADVTRVSTPEMLPSARKPAKSRSHQLRVIFGSLTLVTVVAATCFFGWKILSQPEPKPSPNTTKNTLAILDNTSNSSPFPALPIPPPNPMTMERGRLKIWTGTKNKPLESSGADQYSDFVDVQLFQSFGWVALRANGQAFRWLRRGDAKISMLQERLVSLNRTSDFARGPYLGVNGRLVDRDTGKVTALPKGINRPLIDYAIANWEEAEPAYLTDDGTIHHSSAPAGPFKQIGNWNELLLGLRVNGELVAWEKDGDSPPDLSGTLYSKISSVAGTAIGLTVEGAPVVFGPDRRISQLPTAIESKRFVDVVCGRFIYAARQSDGHWKAWGGDDEEARNVINQLGPNVSTLSIKNGHLAWIETTP